MPRRGGFPEVTLPIIYFRYKATKRKGGGSADTVEFLVDLYGLARSGELDEGNAGWFRAEGLAKVKGTLLWPAGRGMKVIFCFALGGQARSRVVPDFR